MWVYGLSMCVGGEGLEGEGERGGDCEWVGYEDYDRRYYGEDESWVWVWRWMWMWREGGGGEGEGGEWEWGREGFSIAVVIGMYF